MLVIAFYISLNYMCLLTNLSNPLLDCLALLHFGEVVVVQRYISHDGLLIGMGNHDIFNIQELHYTKLVLCQSESMGEAPLWIILA